MSRAWERECRTPVALHLAFLDGLEYWSRQSMTPEQSRARPNAISGTGLVAFQILDTSIALKKKSMLTSPTLVLIRSNLDFFHCFARSRRQARVLKKIRATYPMPKMTAV